MKGTFAALLPLLMMLIVPVPLSAKGDTVKITIKGPCLETPLEIADRGIVAQFNVWTGPGVRINGKAVYMDPNHQYGTFIDWPNGVVPEPPRELPRYEVSFYVKRSAENPVYVVLYQYDPATQRGYMYLPGKGDEWYQVNVRSIFQGVEGGWFYTSRAWEKDVRPLIDKSKRDRSCPPETAHGASAR